MRTSTPCRSFSTYVLISLIMFLPKTRSTSSPVASPTPAPIRNSICILLFGRLWVCRPVTPRLSQAVHAISRRRDGRNKTRERSHKLRNFREPQRTPHQKQQPRNPSAGEDHNQQQAQPRTGADAVLAQNFAQPCLDCAYHLCPAA